VEPKLKDPNVWFQSARTLGHDKQVAEDGGIAED
jgi:hypothetical protein